MGSHRHHHHHHRHEAPQKPRGSLLGIYWRLLRTYAFRHWGYLSIGLFFALLEGGTLNLLCHTVGMVAGSFDGKNHSTAVVQETVDASAEDAPFAAIPEEIPAVQTKESVQTPPTGKIPQVKGAEALSAKQMKKIFKSVELVNVWLRKLGFSYQVDPGDGQHLTGSVVVVLLAGLVFFFTAQALAILVNRYCLKWIGARVVTDMRIDLFNHLMDQSQAFYSKPSRPTGALISRCTNDINAVQGVIAIDFPELIISPIQILAALIFLLQTVWALQLPWWFGSVLLIAAPAVAAVYWLCRMMNRFEHSILDRVSEVTDRMAECFSGVKEIRAFCQEEREKASFSKTNERYFRALQRAIVAEVAVHPILQITVMSLVGVFVGLCYFAGLTIGILGGMAFAAQSIYKPLKDLVKVNAGLQRGAAAAERYFQLMDEDTTLPVPKNPKHLDAFQNEIRFNGVSFHYNPGEADVLKDIDLTIHKGETVALVGQTGSGKSTAASLLARFYDPSQGNITLDGIDLKELDTKDLRKMVSMISQDTFLFNTSIEENIRYGCPEATHEEVVEAARRANALEFIEQDPRGFARPVGERGALLSGGQRQRVAIARAILRNTPILIMDEATSALDTVTETLVQEALNNMMKDRTVLVIAHRLSTIRNASCILVMEEGRVLERGTNQELLELDGKYKQLVDMQFREAPIEDPIPGNDETLGDDTLTSLSL